MRTGTYYYHVEIESMSGDRFKFLLKFPERVGEKDPRVYEALHYKTALTQFKIIEYTCKNIQVSPPEI